MNNSSGRAWPYAIGASIILVAGFCVATVITTSKANIQESDAYMTHYQHANMIVNDMIKAKINFDKKYKIEYVTKQITKSDSQLLYKLTDVNGLPINNAKILLSISRPETKEFNKKIDKFSVNDGIYSFDKVDFPKDGIWNIIAKVSIGDDFKFYNIKADTRKGYAASEF